ncbi:MAG: DUF4332 domain-containing protein [Planctomycetota bacterium]
MRLLHVSSPAEGVGPDVRLGTITAGLAAYHCDSRELSGSVCDLLAELLFGAPEPRWLAAPWRQGEARIHTSLSELQLRRAGARNASRLTLHPIGDRPATAPAPSPAEWQGPVPARVLAAVFFAGPSEREPLAPLLSASVAESFNRLSSRRTLSRRESHDSYEPHRTSDLLRRRDELAARIEALLNTRRQESVSLDEQLARLDDQRVELAGRVEELRRRVSAVADQLDADGARLRYEELTRVAAEAEGRQAADQWAPRVEELDEEVARWRATLAELDSREEYLRNELARVRPDDAAPQILLADQRASVAVAQRLIADLESEVARFARSGESPLCVCDDAHPRMNPLVETLGRHVDRLAELVAQQDRALRTQELLAEASQVERSQTELRRQLEHLLERRQTLWRSSRARTVREGSGEARYVNRIDRPALEAEHRQLAEQLSELEASLAALDRDQHDLAERRRRLLDSGQLGDWQRELDQLQHELARTAEAPRVAATSSLRASDVLARLSDGEFNELRLVPGGRSVEARDRTGRLVRQQDFTAAEQRLVAWALRLALADAAHAADVEFPLVLDQPFDELDDRHAANLATCLDDYARRGRQILLFSGSGAGLNRLRGLGIAVHGLSDETIVVREPKRETRSVVKEEQSTRQLLLDVDDPIERFPVPLADRHDAFARSRVRTVGDLISGDPSAIAEEMNAEGVTAELVALWQAHVALVCFVPGLDLSAAKLLVECDLLSVEELAEADASHLQRAMRKRGARESLLARVEGWITAARGQVDRWRSTGYAKAWSRNRSERRDRIRDNASRRSSRRTERSSSSSRSSDRSSRRTRRRRTERTEHRRSNERSAEKKLRFYLEIDSDIEAAPSIGPKRAAQLTALGVATVSQLLEADPEDLAARLDDNRVDAAKIVAWQHQAGLMCRVPGLRGHDAQVLVGSGFASAEEIAAMKPADLLEFVDPFCDTPEGQRALRGSARPDLAEVSQWIAGARQRRAVGVS